MSKKILGLFVVVVLLGLAAYFMERPFETRFADKEIALYPQLKTESVHAMEIEHLGQALRLEKNSDAEWTAIEGETKSPADAHKVQKAVEAVTHFKKTDPVSINPENQAQYELADTAMKVRLFDGKKTKILEFLIGKQGPDFQSTYLKDSLSPEVYLVEEYLKGSFNTAPSFWGKTAEDHHD